MQVELTATPSLRLLAGISASTAKRALSSATEGFAKLTQKTTCSPTTKRTANLGCAKDNCKELKYQQEKTWSWATLCLEIIKKQILCVRDTVVMVFGLSILQDSVW